MVLLVLQYFRSFILAMAAFLVFMLCRIVYICWILPNHGYMKLKANGFNGPTPSFPIGNINDMKKMKKKKLNSSPPNDVMMITHDIHNIVFPYFSEWKKLHGKVFTYWLGTEAFLYIADPEFLKKMSAGVMGKSWGKPNVFKNDRKPMFGNGLVMVEGDDWVLHRRLITPVFSPANLKGMSGLMVGCATKMLDGWTENIQKTGNQEIDVENEIINTAGEIIAKTSFGHGYENGQKVLEKLREMQITLFNYNRFVGVPFGKYMCPKQTFKARKLGKDIDALLLSIITARINESSTTVPTSHDDLLGLLLAAEKGGDNEGRFGKKILATRELVDECKTFFFAGHETTALALTWTLLCLAMHPEWQTELRQEIRQVIEIGSDIEEIDVTKLAGLKKMGWVMNEVLRLYSPAPNAQRQARQDIQVDKLVVPKGTNVWIDLVSMHHDKELWGENANEFRPERFKDDMLYGGCKHKMGYLPFGFGGRMCVGRNLALMEYKIVLTLVLSRFSISPSPNYTHYPAIMLSLRPRQGMPLILTPL